MWISHKKKVISIQDVIFNKDKVWDGMPIQCTPDEIKVIDEAIKVVQLPEMKIENVQLDKDMREHINIMLLIAY